MPISRGNMGKRPDAAGAIKIAADNVVYINFATYSFTSPRYLPEERYNAIVRDISAKAELIVQAGDDITREAVVEELKRRNIFLGTGREPEKNGEKRFAVPKWIWLIGIGLILAKSTSGGE